MYVPILDLGKGGTEAHQFVFDEEGHHLRQSHLFFLTIGKASHVLALDERLALRSFDMAQRAGSVADERDVLACGQERLDQLDALGKLLGLELRLRLGDLDAQLGRKLLKVERLRVDAASRVTECLIATDDAPLQPVSAMSVLPASVVSERSNDGEFQ